MVPRVRMPALLTKMSRAPRATTVLATAAWSSLAEALSAFRDSALPPADSISRTSWKACSSELEYVNATDAPSAARRRTMPAPMPLEPPVTRATFPLNDFICIVPLISSWPTIIYVLDSSIQNENQSFGIDPTFHGKRVTCNDALCCRAGFACGTGHNYGQ